MCDELLGNLPRLFSGQHMSSLASLEGSWNMPLRCVITLQVARAFLRVPDIGQLDYGRVLRNRQPNGVDQLSIIFKTRTNRLKSS